MKKLNLILLLFFFYSCSPKISNYFEHNRYIKDYSIHIVNDSLQLYLKSPSDISYTKDRKELRKVIRKTNFKLNDSVLIYGKTDDPPYEFFLTISSNDKQNYPKNLIVYDTLIGNQTIQFIGNSLTKNSQNSLRIDLKNIFESLEIGTNYRNQISSVMDIIHRHENSNKFYAILNEINEFPTYDRQEEWLKFQMALTYSSFLGKNEFYENNLKKLESRFQPNDTISKTMVANIKTGNEVIETIVKEAKNHRIIMINENHFYPNHRQLIFDLLSDLKENGYSYLAFESIDIGQDSLLNLEGAFPTLETGFYTREQTYSRVIRKAKELGYKFVAYENSDNHKNRELGQAENLYNKTFKIEPNCKVLVFAGIDHILEKPTQSGKKWMATAFKEKYNIDPLSISQTHLNSYRGQIKSKYGIINSKVFNNDRMTSVDYFVLNNNPIKPIGYQSTFPYENSSKNDIQVSLFYGNEITNKFDYLKKVPYFTTILKSGEKYNLPVNKNVEVYLFTFDINGKRIDKQILTTPQQW